MSLPPASTASDLVASGLAPAAPVPTPAVLNTEFHRHHLVAPMGVLAALFAITNLCRADLWLADALYAWEGHAWSLRHVWATQHLIHLLGREASTAAWLGVFAAWLVACVRSGWRPLQRPLLYLLTATAVSTLLVAGLKSWSNVDCPWDLVRYGGTRPYIGLFELRPAGVARGLCFPAGHASGGYGWLALYFFLYAVKPRWRWAGLAVGVGSGLLFGISQQLRGAHFLSHDVATLAICWSGAVVLHRVFWRDALAPSHSVTTAP